MAARRAAAAKNLSHQPERPRQSAEAVRDLALALAGEAPAHGEHSPPVRRDRPGGGPVVAADHHRRDVVVEVAERHAIGAFCVRRRGLDPDVPAVVPARKVLQEIEGAGEHVVFRYLLQRRNVEARGKLAELRAVARLPPEARDIGIPRVEEDHPARPEVAVELRVGLGGGARLVCRHRPVEKREERQFVGFEVDRDGRGGLDRGAPVERVRQANEPRACDLVDPRIAGDDMGQNDLRGRFERERLLVGLRLGRSRHACDEGRQKGRRRARTRTGETTRQPQRGDDVDEKKQERPAEKSALERGFAAHVETFDRQAGRPGGGNEFGLRRHHVQRDAAVLPGIEAGGQVGAEVALCQTLAGNAGEHARVAHLAEAGQDLIGLPGGAGEVIGVEGRRPGRDREPVEHSDEEPRERQGRPFRVGGDMEQHDLSRAHAFAGHQRRAVGERSDHTVGQVGVGLGHDLGRHLHLVGHRKAEERAVGTEGPQPLRLTPAHRAADGPSARAQPHRHQRVFLFAGDVAGRHARTGETDQQTAVLHPGEKIGLLGAGERGDIGQHDGIGIGQDHVGQRAVEKVGGGFERLFEVVGGRQKTEALALVARRQQRDLASPQRVVGQTDGTGRAQALDLEARHPVADFRRQRKLDRNLALGRREVDLGARQPAGRARRVEPVGGHGKARGFARPRAQGRQQDVVVLEGRRAQPRHRAGAFEDRDRPPAFEGREHVAAPGGVEPVGHPERLERAFERARPVAYRLGIHLPGRGFEARQPRRPCFGGPERGALRRKVREPDDRAPRR